MSRFDTLISSNDTIFLYVNKYNKVKMTIKDVNAYNVSCLFTTLKDNSVTIISYNRDNTYCTKYFPEFGLSK